jgi:hypothetical protein
MARDRFATFMFRLAPCRAARTVKCSLPTVQEQAYPSYFGEFAFGHQLARSKLGRCEEIDEYADLALADFRR